MLFKFFCCEQIFSTFIEFNSHKFSKHNIEHPICGLCYCKVNSIQNLYKHYGEHHFPGLSIRFDDQMNNSILTSRDSTSRHKTAEDMVSHFWRLSAKFIRYFLHCERFVYSYDCEECTVVIESSLGLFINLY